MGKDERALWRSRIVGEGEEAPDQLLAHPHNWRVHPRHQQAALEGVLDDVGWVQRVIVNRRTGHLVDGHLRVALALRRSEPAIPVLYVDLDEREEALVLATLDPVSALAVADAEQLATLLAEVNTGDEHIMAMLDDLAKANGLFGEQPPSLDELEDEYGTFREDDIWPELRLRLPPDAYERYVETVARFEGDDEAHRFMAMVDAVPHRASTRA